MPGRVRYPNEEERSARGDAPLKGQLPSPSWLKYFLRRRRPERSAFRCQQYETDRTLTRRSAAAESWRVDSAAACRQGYPIRAAIGGGGESPTKSGGVHGSGTAKPMRGFASPGCRLHNVTATQLDSARRLRGRQAVVSTGQDGCNTPQSQPRTLIAVLAEVNCLVSPSTGYRSSDESKTARSDTGAGHETASSTAPKACSLRLLRAG